MTIHRLAIVLAAVLLGGCGKVQEKAEVRPAAKLWADRVAQVEPGMTRAAVEVLLPPNPAAPSKRRVEGKSQVVTYWLDDQWRVTLTYDLSGVSTEAKSQKKLGRPQNKLLKKPVLERQYL